MRVLLETVHIAIGLLAAALMAAAGAWAYPQARGDIWLVGYAAMVAVALMGIGPLRRAFRTDRAKLSGTSGARDHG